MKPRRTAPLVDGTSLSLVILIVAAIFGCFADASLVPETPVPLLVAPINHPGLCILGLCMFA